MSHNKKKLLKDAQFRIIVSQDSRTYSELYYKPFLYSSVPVLGKLHILMTKSRGAILVYLVETQPCLLFCEMPLAASCYSGRGEYLRRRLSVLKSLKDFLNGSLQNMFTESCSIKCHLICMVTVELYCGIVHSLMFKMRKLDSREQMVA